MAHAGQNSEYVDQGGHDAADGLIGEVRSRPRRAPSTRQPSDHEQQPAVRPAHPLPECRSGSIDYDRYLQRSTDKFKIFSAAERRRRKRNAAMGAAIVALVVIIVVWAILSQTA